MIDEDMIAKIKEEHGIIHESGGDGYTSPRESWIVCTCGDLIWTWQQHYQETEEDPEENYAFHLLGVYMEKAWAEGHEETGPYATNPYTAPPLPEPTVEIDWTTMPTKNDREF